jgi:hypothetical protein
MRFKSESPKEYYARSSYERFILSQPHVKCEGLYKDSKGWFFIYCPEATPDMLALDGSTIETWFQQHKALVSPIRLAFSLPDDCIRVQTRTIEEMVHLTGEPLNEVETSEALKKHLPREFPLRGLDSVTKERNYISLILTRELTKEEEAVLEDSLSKIGLPVDVLTFVEQNTSEDRVKLSFPRQADLRLLPIFYAHSQLPKQARKLYEEDEDFWITNELQLFNSTSTNYKGILKSKPAKNACIVNGSVFQSINFRVLYTMYDHVYLAMPIEGRLADFLESIHLSKDDLLELSRSGRLTLLLPLSFNRYRFEDLDPFWDEESINIIGPRRLTALSMIASKRRFPLLYTSLNAEERAIVLRILYSASQKVDSPESILIQQLVRSLSRIWQLTEYLIQNRGTIGTSATGLGSLYGDLVNSVSGIDAWLEITGAAQTLEWGIGLKADMIPTQVDGYDEYRNAENLAALYSGFKKYPYVTAATKSGIIIEGILAVDNEMPIMELIDAIGSADRAGLK